MTIVIGLVRTDQTFEVIAPHEHHGKVISLFTTRMQEAIKPINLDVEGDINKVIAIEAQSIDDSYAWGVTKIPFG